MKYGKIKGLDKPVPRLVLGSMVIDTRDLDRSFAVLDAALERGYTAIDTAHVYGGGNSERALGQWMTQRGNRDQVVVLTKGAHHNGDRKRVTPYDITADLHDSLARLKTDHIDIYLLHRDDPTVAVGPIVEILNEHKRAGKIRCFGGSNWTHRRIAEANAYAEANGLEGFAASSPNFSLAWQMEEPWPDCITISGPDNAEARQWYVETQMPVMAYSSLGRGFCSGRISRSNFERIKDTIDPACIKSFCHEPNFERLDRAEKMAAEKNTDVPTLAMAYVMSQPMNLFALVGAENAAEMDGNLGALDLSLSESEIAWLENGR